MMHSRILTNVLLFFIVSLLIILAAIPIAEMNALLVCFQAGFDDGKVAWGGGIYCIKDGVPYPIEDGQITIVVPNGDPPPEWRGFPLPEFKQREALYGSW